MSPSHRRRGPPPAVLAFNDWVRDLLSWPYLVLRSADGVIVSANDAFCAQYGASRDTVEGRSLATVPGWESAHAPLRRALAAACEGAERFTPTPLDLALPGAARARVPVTAFLLGGGLVGAVLHDPAARAVRADTDELLGAVTGTLAIVRALVSIGDEGATRSTLDRALLAGRISAMMAALAALRGQADGRQGGGRDPAVLPRAVIGSIDGAGSAHGFEGPALELSIRQALALSLILHDIAAAMLFEGGVRQPGELRVVWRVLESSDRPALLRFEISGPSPSGSGPGLREASAFARELCTRALDGTMVLVASAQDGGARCVIEFPLH